MTPSTPKNEAITPLTPLNEETGSDLGSNKVVSKMWKFNLLCINKRWTKSDNICENKPMNCFYVILHKIKRTYSPPTHISSQESLLMILRLFMFYFILCRTLKDDFSELNVIFFII